MSEPEAGHVPGQLDLHGEEVDEVLEAMERVRERARQSVSNAAAERDVQERRLTEAVLLARAAGISWEDIGSAAGVTRQAAWQRWGKR